MHTSITLSTFIFVFLSGHSLSVEATAKHRGIKGHQNDVHGDAPIFRQLSKSKSKKQDDLYNKFIEEYQDPPAGLTVGDVVQGPCSVELSDDLHAYAEIHAIVLNADDGDVSLDCKGHKIIGYHDSDAGILIRGSNDHTVTIKNCVVTGYNVGFAARGDSFDDDDTPENLNIVIENSVAVSNEEDGFFL